MFLETRNKLIFLDVFFTYFKVHKKKILVLQRSSILPFDGFGIFGISWAQFDNFLENFLRDANFTIGLAQKLLSFFVKLCLSL